MLKRVGLLAAGIVIGVVLTEILIEQEKTNQEIEANRKNGMYAEVLNNTVRTYEIKNGSFCGYSDPIVFESQDKAIEWVLKETNAKLVLRQE